MRCCAGCAPFGSRVEWVARHGRDRAEQGARLGDELDGEMHAAGGACRVECPPWRRSRAGRDRRAGPDFAASGC
eukprot:3303098-Pyramimonas_sp.AAC.1